MWRSACLLGLIYVPFLSIAQSLSVIQKPITWNAERERLSIDYLRERHGIVQDSATIVPQMIVIHWTENNSIRETFKMFNPVRLPGRPELQKASSLNVSSQYLVDRDGKVYQLLPDTIFARHTIGLNYCAIGIENIGSNRRPLTQAQLDANEQLVRMLKAKYSIRYMIGHLEYAQFRHTPLWKESDPDYITEKDDPGHGFMDRLRAQTHDLNLKNYY